MCGQCNYGGGMGMGMGMGMGVGTTYITPAYSTPVISTQMYSPMAPVVSYGGGAVAYPAAGMCPYCGFAPGMCACGGGMGGMGGMGGGGFY